jgi:4'-phosphopantetheinyl transferase
MTAWLDALAGCHEAHLWYVLSDQVTDQTLLAAYRKLLNPEELARNGRFVFEQGRHEHLLTRALVRTTLSRYQPAVDPRDWRFVTGPFGRPEIAAPILSPPFRFNLSNTHGLIVCLVAVEREIGVDVEDTARAHQVEMEIADHYFSPIEAAELRALPAAAQPSRFFDYWTLKEAYIKARGLGLQLPLDQFSLHLGAVAEPAQPIRIAFGPGIADDPRTWQFSLGDLTHRHRLATAIRRRPDESDLALRQYRVVPLGDSPA